VLFHVQYPSAPLHQLRIASQIDLLHLFTSNFSSQTDSLVSCLRLLLTSDSVFSSFAFQSGVVSRGLEPPNFACRKWLIEPDSVTLVGANQRLLLPPIGWLRCQWFGTVVVPVLCAGTGDLLTSTCSVCPCIYSIPM
jgi:hypothetical protein